METRPYEEVESGYRYFEEGDVLFAKITPSMQNGKAAIARNLIDDFGLGSTEFHVLRPKSDVLPEWIYHYIRRTKFRNEAMQRFRGAAGQQRVPKDFLENHVIPVPYPEEPERSLAVQQQMVAHFEAVKQETIEMLKLSKENEDRLDVLEQAILAQAFRGEV
jgi:type I restriction enzyme S subunit